MRPDRGSVLLLFPAGVLVVLLLGAIAVDASIAFLGQREIANAVAAAANDAATASLSDAAFYGSGDIALDEARATDLAEARVRGALDPTRFHDLTVDVRVDPCRRIVTGKDWMKKELQEKYKGRFCWFLQRKIEALK